jgi:hypothetical protein
MLRKMDNFLINDTARNNQTLPSQRPSGQEHNTREPYGRHCGVILPMNDGGGAEYTARRRHHDHRPSFIVHQSNSDSRGEALDCTKGEMGFGHDIPKEEMKVAAKLLLLALPFLP